MIKEKEIPIKILKNLETGGCKIWIFSTEPGQEEESCSLEMSKSLARRFALTILKAIDEL